MNSHFKAALSVSLFSFMAAQSAIAQVMEEIVISARPIPKTVNDSLQPVSVLNREQIDEKGGATLGATLANEPGVAASSFGPAASRPIIRGLGGDRIKILENGVSSQDISNTSPDHATAVEPLLADKIEVVRGPAAILFGTSAIGGVVNVMDNRIPDERPAEGGEERFEMRGGTADLERTGIGAISVPVDDFALNLNFSDRITDDMNIPGSGKLDYSDSSTQSGSVGSSYFFENGFIGAAFSQYDSDYGLPNGEPDVSIDLNRKRFDIRGKANDLIPGIETAEFKAGIVDYEHTEYEGDEVGTVYNSNGIDTRLDFTHGKLGPLSGSFGFQYQYSDLKAVGEEAFVPPSVTNIASAFIFEELPIAANWSLQFGGRYDLTDVAANERSIDRSFDTFGETVGVVWKPIAGYSATLSVAHTERAPTQQELFSNGPHPATAQFEIGDEDLDTEGSVGTELTFRKTEGETTGSIGTFYNRFSDYINLSANGESIDGLPVSEYVPISAEFFGFEGQLAHHLLESNPEAEDLAVELQTDYVWASDRRTGEPLPRIPPLRTRLSISYFNEEIGRAKLEYLQSFRQDRNSDFETETPQYSMLNLYLSKDVAIRQSKLEIFLRGTNLLNETARDATSYIKDVAPLAGVSAVAGIRFKF